MSRFIRRGIFLFAAGLAAGAGGVTLLRPALVPTPAVGPAELTPVEAALDKPIPEIDLVDVPLPDAARRIGELAGVPVTVDAASFAAIALPPPTQPVTMRARNITLAAALDELVQGTNQASAGGGVHWTPLRDRVTIGLTSAGPPRPSGPPVPASVLRTYNVKHLLGTIEPVDDSPTFSLVGQTGPYAPRQPHEDLVKLIMDSVAPDSWRENGGMYGFIDYKLGRLVVVQTVKNHRDVRRLLQQLSEPPSPPLPPEPPTPDVVRWHDGLGKWVVRNDVLAERKLLAVLPEFRTEGSRRDTLQRWAAAVGVDLLIDPSADVPLPHPVDDPTKAELPDRKLMAEPVAVALRSGTAADALRAILDGPGTRLTWWYDGEVVLVGAREAAEKQAVTRVYDLRDWFDAQPEVVAATQPSDRTRAREAASEDLRRCVQGTVDPGSWREDGGAPGVAKELSRQLIVTQTAEAQLAVRKLLDEVRSGARRPSTRPAIRP